MLLDSGGRFRIEVDEAGAPAAVTLDGRPGRILAYEPGMDLGAVAAGALLTAPTSMSMRTAIELRQATGHPVALMDGDRLVGVCGDEEIYRGILRQSSLADEPAQATAPSEGSVARA